MNDLIEHGMAITNLEHQLDAKDQHIDTLADMYTTLLDENKRLQARNALLEDVAKAAKLSQNYGPDSTDTEWDDFWRGIEKSLSKLEES